MTETIFIENIKEVKANKKELEDKLSIKISIKGKQVTYEGDSMKEYEASLVFNAMAFGFSAIKSIQLIDEEMQFEMLHMRDFTRKRSLKDVKARLIGTEGKTRKTIENITGSDILVKDSEVGIICNTESMEDAITAIKNIIKGTKQSNAYKYLERMNSSKKKDMRSEFDLGLKDQ